MKERTEEIKDLISIITPCYNSEKYIEETIKSVLGQTYTAWEMIIIDDGSTDHSACIVQKYVEKEPRIRLVAQENKGSAAARNCGIRQAKGQYIALLDADDLWDREFLSNQLQFMARQKAVCVCCSYRRINEESKEVHSPVFAKRIITERDMLRRNYIGCLTGLYDVSKYGKVYLHEELKSMRDDYAYWIDIVHRTGIVYGNPEILASYRMASGSTTGKKVRLIPKQYQFYRRYLKQGPVRSVMNTICWGVAGLAGLLAR